MTNRKFGYWTPDLVTVGVDMDNRTAVESHSSIEIAASRERVFDVIVDPATYPSWLVGAQRIRSIDGDWPAEGSTFRHVLGFGVLAVPGSTTVRALDRPRRLVLSAGMGPFGATRVEFELSALSEEMTLLRVVENPARGLIHEAARVVKPAAHLLLWGRNQVSLANCRSVVESSIRPEE